MVIIGGTQCNEFPKAESADGKKNLFLVDVLTKEVHYEKTIKPFRMFGACGKGK